jgi:hypothetical protein
MIMQLRFSAFYSRSVSFLETTEAPAFFYIMFTFLPNILRTIALTKPDVYHLISKPPGLPEPS